MHDTILRLLLKQQASLRFEVKEEKARKFRFRVFDRKLNRTIAQFDLKVEADNYHLQLIQTFVKDTYDAILSDPSVWIDANA
jgi:hypothetical protein